EHLGGRKTERRRQQSARLPPRLREASRGERPGCRVASGTNRLARCDTLTRPRAAPSGTLSRNAGEGLTSAIVLNPLPHRGRGGTGRCHSAAIASFSAPWAAL